MIVFINLENRRHLGVLMVNTVQILSLQLFRVSTVQCPDRDLDRDLDRDRVRVP